MSAHYALLLGVLGAAVALCAWYYPWAIRTSNRHRRQR